MLKINKDLKPKQLPIHILAQLQPLPVSQIKTLVFGAAIFLLDLLIIVPLLAPPIKLFLYLTLPLLAFISLWALRLLVKNPIHTEMESILFTGWLGVIGAFCYFMLGLKYSYMLGITSPIYYIFSILLFIGANYLFIRRQLNRYATLEPEESKQTPAWHYQLASVSVPAGYMVTHYLMGLSNQLVLSVMMMVYLMLSTFYMFLMAKYFHKYFFIKTNRHLVILSNENRKKKQAKEV
ncbi:hypothetical protein [Metabacillus iocasae]|uniref:Uncharacterized protein n=1 Tax=Priestia iocasae TaxID=2291674 RepID=A0ABS2QVI7_9BACI|nr:hypothetical protein [Metabacillus iocasae]MBM7703283.1 hypothetical protein [Metabacillus iocasae]